MTTPPRDLTAERAAQIVGIIDGLAYIDPNDHRKCEEAIRPIIQQVRQEALREAARVVETITLQAVKTELRWRKKHAVEEVEGVAKSERAECHMRSLGLHIKGELDRLASEGAPAPIDLLPKLKDDGGYGEHF